MRDWQIRAIKTFIQSFFGVLVPELCLVLTSGFPVNTWGATLAPFVCSALAAGISAVWNIIKEHLEKWENDEY